jgi:hypothetical protein
MAVLGAGVAVIDKVANPGDAAASGLARLLMIRFPSGLVRGSTYGDQRARRWTPMTPEDRFGALIDQFIGLADITPPGSGSGFGSQALRSHNKIFAMLADGRLVVKLPKARVDSLVAAGEGVRFDAGKGTPMKEWFSLDAASAWPGRRSPARRWTSSEQLSTGSDRSGFGAGRVLAASSVARMDQALGIQARQRGLRCARSCGYTA